MEADAESPKDRGAGRGGFDAPRVSYVTREDATPEAELAALAACYAFVLEAHQRESAAPADGGTKKEVEDGS